MEIIKEKPAMIFIFDFDGTLVDSFNSVIDKLIQLSDELNFKRISISEADHLKDLNSREIIKYLKIPIYKIPSVIYKLREALKNEMSELSTFANLEDTLTKIHRSNVFLGIVTSNSEENVVSWLDTHNMGYLFNFIHSESNYFGKSRVIKKILKKYSIKNSNTFYIGDETRDIEAAKKNNLSSIAVTWGFNSEKVLLASQPDYLARRPEDLLKIIEVNSSAGIASQ